MLQQIDHGKVRVRARVRNKKSRWVNKLKQVGIFWRVERGKVDV
jgi:hypothetical protein